MRVPYDTGKIKIGITYQPPTKKYYSSDQDWIQELLLGIKPAWGTRLSHYLNWTLLAVCLYIVLAIYFRD